MTQEESQIQTTKLNFGSMSGNGAGKTQQVLFYETKVVEKNRVEERTSYPYWSNKKDEVRLF